MILRCLFLRYRFSRFWKCFGGTFLLAIASTIVVKEVLIKKTFTSSSSALNKDRVTPADPGKVDAYDAYTNNLLYSSSTTDTDSVHTDPTSYPNSNITTIIGDRRNALKQALERVASPDRNVLIILTDNSVTQMTLNFYLTSLVPHNITNYLFISSEPDHCQTLESSNISCFSIGNDTINMGLDGSKGLLLRTKEYLRRMNLRLETWLECLKMGFNVLASDVDMTFVQNPFPRIKSNDGKVYGLYCMTDGPTSINAGFMMIRAVVKVIKRLEKALQLLRVNSTLDDQTAINSAFSSRWDGTVYPLSQTQFSSGLTYWEKSMPSFSREFRDETKPCTTCVVIHNNFIVSIEAKIYRMRESGMWVVDNDQYYSDPNRMYLTYKNPLLFHLDEHAKIAEWNALKNALAFAQILNRTLILPKFRCGLDRFEVRQYRNCNFLHRTKLRLFEQYFPDYREHSFLQHELVPASTKASMSPWICLNVSNPYFSRRSLRTCNSSVPLLFPEKGASETEVLTHYGNSHIKVLRFSSMYGTFYEFEDPTTDQEFKEICRKVLTNCDYRQREGLIYVPPVKRSKIYLLRPRKQPPPKRVVKNRDVRNSQQSTSIPQQPNNMSKEIKSYESI